MNKKELEIILHEMEDKKDDIFYSGLGLNLKWWVIRILQAILEEKEKEDKTVKQTPMEISQWRENRIKEDLIKKFRDRFGGDAWLGTDREAIEQFITQILEEKIKETYDKGYSEGLNLRKEYNDPELLKEIKEN